LALVERGHGANDGEEGGERVAEADAAPRRRSVGATGGEADATDRFADAAEAGFAGARTGLAEARNVHHDEAGIAGGDGGVVEAPLVEPAGPEVLEHHVDVVDELGEEIPPAFVAKVDGHGALVASDAGPPQAFAVEGDAPAAHGVALARGLDLDDLGSVVAEELAGEGSGDEAAQLEDPHAGQGPEASAAGSDGHGRCRPVGVTVTVETGPVGRPHPGA
jgi:hypothetical protein